MTLFKLTSGGLTSDVGRQIQTTPKSKYEFDDFPRNMLPQPFYYGPLRRGENPVLLVAGLIPKDRDSVYGKAYLWLYRRSPVGVWILGWAEKWSDSAPFFEGVLAFNAPGDATKQICIYSSGADNTSMMIYGFRGKEDKPKELHRSEGKGLPVVVKERERYVVVEHWAMVHLIQAEKVKIPLPSKLQGHVFARRTFGYSTKRDRYIPVGGYEPDRERERHLTPKEFEEERKKLKVLIQWGEQLR